MQQKQTHKQYGLFTGLAIMILGLILYVLDMSFKPWAQYLVYIPFLVGLVMNAHAYSKANDGYVTFGQTFASGFKAASIATLIAIVWALVSSYIFPEMMDKAMDAARENMVKQGQSDEDIEKAIQMTSKYFKVFMIAGVLFMYMFVGAIFSLIAAAMAKKKGEMPPNMQAE